MCWSLTGVGSCDGVDAQPDITLCELQARLAKERVVVSQTAISASFVILNSPLKKSLHAAEQDRPDVAAALRAWFKMQTRLDPRRLVFIDETSASTNMTRRTVEGHAVNASCARCRMVIGRLRPSLLRCATMGSRLLCYWMER
jgi:hypothetical protein